MDRDRLEQQQMVVILGRGAAFEDGSSDGYAAPNLRSSRCRQVPDGLAMVD